MSQITLTWREGGQGYTHKMSDERPIIIGRRADCNITLSDPTVSRQHAQIYAHNGIFYVHNLSRTSPVRVDQKALQEGETAALGDGNVLYFGNVQMQVISVDASEQLDPDVFKVKCARCGNDVDIRFKDCPWCGMNLAGAATHF